MQVSIDHYAIAWQKLAESIMYGKKEHALGIYRLLSRSFENKAVVHQLQGDIFLAFNDLNAAHQAYTQAAQLYEQQGNIECAQCVAHHAQMLHGVIKAV